MPPHSLALSTELSLDDALSCLSNERRRHTIEIMYEHGESLPLSDVAERVAARDYGVDRQSLSSSQRKCVYTGLYQAHMKTLTEVDAVGFDERAKVLEPAENTAPLAKTIRLLREQYDVDG